MNRQAFDVKKYSARLCGGLPEQAPTSPVSGRPLDYNTGNPRALGGNPDITPFLKGPAQPPAANEAGWKDTVIMLPGQVTRIAVRWAPTDLPASTDPGERLLPLRPRRRPRLRLALPHHRSRGQRDDAPYQRPAQPRRGQDLHPGTGLLRPSRLACPTWT